MTLQKMHKRGEAGRRGEVAARFAASHPAEDIVGRGDMGVIEGRADAKAEPTSVPTKGEQILRFGPQGPIKRC
jgi:hypothetical protein